MRLKKIIIAATLLIVFLIVAIYTFLAFYDFNKFKPMIARAVKDATGRELIIKGNIDIELGIRPTLIVEDVSFQNATWSSTPNLAQVKRLQVQIAVLPLITGKFDFVRLVLIEPEVIVEFDRTGVSNFSFDTTDQEADESKIPPPPLIFSDALVEKGLFTYQDAQSDFKFTIRINRLTAEIPGFDKSLQLNFNGAFDDIAFTLNGTAGPIWAWVEPGHSVPADLTLGAGGATAKVEGELRDPIHFKNMLFTISAEGASISDVGKLFGMKDMPQLGAFKLTAQIADPEGIPAVEELDARVGSEELVEISINGVVKDLLSLQGIHLNFTAHGKDTANLTQIGIPPPPEREAFQISGRISDIASKVYAASDLKVVLGKDEITGQVNLNLAEQVPFLTAELASENFDLGLFNLNVKLTAQAEKLAIETLDLKLGNPDLAEIRLKGVVDDLLKLEGVDIHFEAHGTDLANLKQLTGRPLPLRGAFNASGKVLMPVHKNLIIPDLRVVIGKNNINGSLGLDLRGDKQQLSAALSSQKLDLPSVLLPELAKQEWVKGLGSIRPVKLAVTLSGFIQEFAVRQADFQAGTYDSVEVRLTGSIENLPDFHGINFKFNVRGKELARLKEIVAQQYFFAPVPGQGAYAVSGNVSDSAANNFKVSDLMLVLAENELTGRLDLNLAVQPPQYQVELSAPKFNVKPFPIPKEAVFNKLNQIDNLGPLKIHSKVIVEGGHLSLPLLDLEAGSEQLAAVEVKGAIKDLTVQRGIDLNFKIQGKEIANLERITGQPIPLQGPYAISGKLTDPGAKNYKVGDLKLMLGENNITGRLDLNLAAQPLQFAAELATPEFNLQPVTLPAIEPLTRISDLGALELAVNLVGSGNRLALENLSLKLGSEQLIDLNLEGGIKNLTVLQGMKLDFSILGNDLAAIQKLGGPVVPLQGSFVVSGQFVDPAPKIYRIPSLKAVLGDNDVSGWVEVNLSKDRPSVSAELSSQKLDLRPFLAMAEKESAAIAQSATSGLNKNKIFSSEPLQLESLNVIDASIKLQEKHVLLPALALNDVNIDILLLNGNLQIKPFTFMVGGGTADVQFDLRSQDKPPRLAVAKVIDQLDLGPMLDELGYERNLEGKLDTDIELTSQGNSLAELMAGLEGYIFITMSDGRVSSNYLNLLQKYLGSNILQLVNPFQAKAKFEQINCFFNTIEIKDGLANVKILLDTKQTSILGAGDVNLKTETLNLGIKPTPKKGHGLSGIGTVSFSFKELSQPFRLGGTLAKPSLVIDPSRTAFTIGKFAGALALGPAGIAAFFADVSLGKKDPCLVAKQSMEEKYQALEGKKADETPKKKDKKSGGFFRRLFGK